MSTSLRTTLVLVGLVPAAIAVVTAPPPALLAVTALGALVGLLAGAGVTFVRGGTAHAGPIGLAAAGVATESGLVVAGVLVTLGAASVAVLPALFLLVGGAWWVDSSRRVPADVQMPPGPNEERRVATLAGPGLVQTQCGQPIQQDP